ncbi:hypothetical protein C8Q70DRAFT_1050728 [Cubamyces menziesii]|nr:hypothetical protein C8Q70DRAFT_1050728 [Cubamyces menziesii]
MSNEVGHGVVAVVKVEHEEISLADLEPAKHPPSEVDPGDKNEGGEVLSYDPQLAGQRALELVDSIWDQIHTLPLGSNMRKEEFRETVASLRRKGATSTTTIVVCGSTGAGKSSLINALLGEPILPTSGMKACTSFVTEIAYNASPGYRATIELLTLQEWEDEIALLLGDLRDAAGKESEEFEAAKAKVLAVYPTMSLNDISTMTVDGVLAHGDLPVTLSLGSKASVQSEDVAKFQKELSRYMDSREGLLNRPGPPARSGTVPSPAYWPLIRHVQIFVKSPILQHGAVLVDVPGTGDSNPARNRIAQSFLAKADKFFIVAPIVRAVSDKVASDLCGDVFKNQLRMNGKYHSEAITFIATKCDDVSCSEIINDLRLSDEPDFQRIVKRVEECESKLKSWRESLERFQATERQQMAHRAGLQGADPSTPEPRRRRRGVQGEQSANAASKGIRGDGAKRSCDAEHIDDVTLSKRRRLEVPMELDDPPNSHTTTSQDVAEPASPLPDEHGDIHFAEMATTLRRINDIQDLIRIGTNNRDQALRERELYCIKQRSEWSKASLKRQFRAGIEEMEACMPDDGEEYEAECDADLPVFTVSARAYMLLQGGDLEAERCSFKESDTEIPALCEWIQTITLPSRERTAAEVLILLKDFAQSVDEWLDGIPGVSLQDCEALRERWRSKKSQAAKGNKDRPIREVQASRYHLKPDAMVPMLIKAFHTVVDDMAGEFPKRFAAKLQNKWRASAEEASSELVEASKKFVTSRNLHHQTYAATLRRNGVHHHNLNAELALPFTKRIARLYVDMFRGSPLKTLEAAVMHVIESVLSAVVDSAPPYLRLRATQLAKATVDKIRRRTKLLHRSVRSGLESIQQSSSGFLGTFIQAQLLEGYQQASEVKGRGRFIRQQNTFNAYLETKKATLFSDAAAALATQVDEASKATRDALDQALEEIASKIEVQISILWEGCHLAGDEDIKTRVKTKMLLADTIAEVDRWLAAKARRDRDARQLAAPVAAQAVAGPSSSSSAAERAAN